jgi:hypothetical protein
MLAKKRDFKSASLRATSARKRLRVRSAMARCNQKLPAVKTTMDKATTCLS